LAPFFSKGPHFSGLNRSSVIYKMATSDFVHACAAGELDVVKQTYATIPRGEINHGHMYAACTGAVSNGHVDVIEFLCELPEARLCVQLPYDLIRSAMSRNRRKITIIMLKYVHNPGELRIIFSHVCQSSDLALVRAVHARVESDPIAVHNGYTRAAIQNCLNVMRYLEPYVNRDTHRYALHTLLSYKDLADFGEAAVYLLQKPTVDTEYRYIKGSHITSLIAHGLELSWFSKRMSRFNSNAQGRIGSCIAQHSKLSKIIAHWTPLHLCIAQLVADYS
jgi:hypothetical protein